MDIKIPKTINPPPIVGTSVATNPQDAPGMFNYQPAPAEIPEIPKSDVPVRPVLFPETLARTPGYRVLSGEAEIPERRWFELEQEVENLQTGELGRRQVQFSNGVITFSREIYENTHIDEDYLSGELDRRKIIKFDPQNPERVISRTEYNPKTNTTVVYTFSDNPTHTEYQSSRGYFTQRATTYNEQGQRISTLETAPNGDKRTTSFEYYDNGMLQTRIVNPGQPDEQRTDIPPIYGETSGVKCEGLDRRLSTIVVSQSLNAKAPGVIEELERIGEEVGFVVQTTRSNSDIWVEDYTIRRSDGSVYIPNTSNVDENPNRIISPSRQNISLDTQGAVAARKGSADNYLNAIPDEYKVQGQSYLEGGNVLNARLADGRAGAVIGDESIDYTLVAMGLENTPENRETAKAVIAADLGLEPENVTFIPQYDFHIDMLYRPLQNGVMAVPDYEGSIEIVSGLLQDPDLDEKEKTQLENLLTGLRGMHTKTADISTQAQERLEQGGYKIVKVPCFSVTHQAYEQQDAYRNTPNINFMNGVGATAQDGRTYFITNTSGMAQLDNAMEQYFQNEAGIDRIFFTSTNVLLAQQGGLDCVTQEY